MGTTTKTSPRVVPATRQWNEPPPMQRRRRLLRQGMRGSDIKAAQEQLLANGYFTGVPGGYFGPITKEAVITFKMQHINRFGTPLTVDAIIGPQTWDTIWNASGSAQRSYLPNAPSSPTIPTIPSGITGHRHDILSHALQDHRRGTHEKPNGTNYGDGVTKFLKGIGPAPWCMYAVSYWYKKTTGHWPHGHRHGHCRTYWNEANENRIAHPKKDYLPIPGDIFIMLYPGGSSGHTGLVVRVSESGHAINTIEGNTGNRVKFGHRYITQKTLHGFINPWDDYNGRNSRPFFEAGLVPAPKIETSLTDTR